MECVVLAAGEGKRMRPLTTKRPKVMLPLVNRPMIEHLVISAREAGIKDFVFVVGYHEQEIRKHFMDGSPLGVNIRYVTQRHQRGTADALAAAENLISGRFLMLNGDMILKSDDIRDICACAAPCMGVTPSTHPQDFGVVTVDGSVVTGLVEKSETPPGNLINAGVYLFDPEIFEKLSLLELSERGELELTDALSDYINSRSLNAFSLSSWMDVGEPWDILDANESMLSDLEPDIKGDIEDFVTITGPVALGEGSVIRAGTCIEGPCIIGRGCKIGPHAYIRGSTAIGDNCHIGHCTEIKNSVIFPGTKIPHFNYIGDSVIGSGCNFGAGTKIANLRHDHGHVKVSGRDTGRKKFGAVVGDLVQFGINCSINVGSVIGSSVKVAPGSSVEGHISGDTVIGR